MSNLFGTRFLSALSQTIRAVTARSGTVPAGRMAGHAGAHVENRLRAVPAAAELHGRKMRTRPIAMAGGAEVDLMASRAALRFGRGLGSVVVLTPGDDMVLWAHGLVTLIAGIASISRQHRVTAGARVGIGACVVAMVATKGLGMVRGSLGGWHVRTRCQRAQTGRARAVAGLAAPHTFLQRYPLAVVVARDAHLHRWRGVHPDLEGSGCRCAIVTGRAGDQGAAPVAPVLTVIEVQVSRYEIAVTRQVLRCVAVAVDALRHGRGVLRGRFRRVTACAVFVARAA